jgi:hypothetical protein
MIDAQISSSEFDEAIKTLKPRLAVQIIYVHEADSVLIAPLFRLAEVEAKAKKLKKKNPEHAEYLGELAREWTSIISRSAIEHPCWRKLFVGINKALKGEMPKSPPAWTRYFHRTLITSDNGIVHVRSYPILTGSDKDGSGWGATPEPASDLYKVLEALGYGSRPKLRER